MLSSKFIRSFLQTHLQLYNGAQREIRLALQKFSLQLNFQLNLYDNSEVLIMSLGYERDVLETEVLNM